VTIGYLKLDAATIQEYIKVMKEETGIFHIIVGDIEIRNEPTKGYTMGCFQSGCDGCRKTTNQTTD